jgi:Dockerin type I domain
MEGKGRLGCTVAMGSLLCVTAWAQGPTIGSCPVFPANNIWNMPVDKLPVSSHSSTYISTIGQNTAVHPDFGTVYNGAPNGIGFVTVPGTQTKYPATFTYSDESDPGPYAIPLNAPIEGGSNSTGDRHVISIDTSNCILYEMWSAYPKAASWQAGSGAIFNLASNALRPAGWTSGDAAGLPIFPGLIRYDEVLAGAINHAVRFTVPQTQNTYVWPARHQASSLTDPKYPPMGVRFRLRADFDVSTFSVTNQIILTAMKKYGLIIADNGSAWYISGAPDSRWSDDDLHNLGRLKGSDFEAVDVSPMMINANSGQAATCDLNDDGVVNVLDVQLEVNATLGLRACDAADLNGDGVCDATDFQRMTQAVLGLGCHVGP